VKNLSAKKDWRGKGFSVAENIARFRQQLKSAVRLESVLARMQPWLTGPHGQTYQFSIRDLILSECPATGKNLVPVFLR
jgi:hypothetical protein